MPAFSMAMEAVLEVDGKVTEDACWLQQEKSSVLELDAAIRDLNFAVWVKRLVLMTDLKKVPLAPEHLIRKVAFQN